MKPISAAVDLAAVFVVVTAMWSLRFLGLPYVGAITMAVALVLVFGVLKARGQRAAVIGLGTLPAPRTLLATAGRLLPWFGSAWLIGAVVGVALFGQPQTGGAVTQLPDNPWGLLFDVTIVTWVLIGFGEETVFRGFVLHRLMALVQDQRHGRWLACGIQAAWFGSLHASQGGAGMVMAGAIGFSFAWFYLSQSRGNLWPLILVHAITDTVILSASWFVR